MVSDFSLKQSFIVFCAVNVCLLLFLNSGKTAAGQSKEVALAEQVQTLIDQLNSTAIEDRDSAQNELVALPPDALDYIDVPDKDATTDFIERLLAVRKMLESKAVEQTTQPTTVSIEGEFSVEQVLKKIASQTGNSIGLREGVSPDVAQRQVTLSLKAGSVLGSCSFGYAAVKPRCRSLRRH